VFVGDRGVGTLMDLRSRTHWRAGDGEPGGKRQMTGANGEDLVVHVPVGTIVRDADTGDVLFEILADTEERIAVEGGRGGLGNVHFKSSTNRAPRTTTPGGPGAQMLLRLELRLMADVGLLGFPNAGKSTLISTVSSARPKVADYPFTTLVPNLGVVSMGTEGSFVVADIPGLIEGAAEGKGLGHQFLRHLQRTRILLHLVSLADDAEGDVATRYRVLRDELGRYDPALQEKPEIVVLTKADAADPETIDAARAALPGARVISAVSGQGVPELVRELWARLRETSA
jgi:GTP-binding protein